MLRIGICDDCEQDRLALRELLRALPSYRRAGDLQFCEYTGAAPLLFQYEDDAKGLDVLFLDVYMPGLTGMDAARRLRALGMKTPIVFLTTSPDFALESYEVSAFDYLLKPVDNARLSAVMDRVEQARRQRKYYVFRKGATIRKVFHDEIVYAESRDHFILLHLENEEELRTLGRIDELEQALGNACFLRAHQSYLVNMAHIVKAGDVFLTDTGQAVPIRKKDRKAICDQYHKWLMQEAFA